MCPIWARLCQRLSGFIPEAAEENEDQVQDPADAEEADSEQPDDAGADLADVEAVSAKVAQEQAQEEGNPLPLMDVAENFVDIGVLIHNVDDRLLGCCMVLATTVLRRAAVWAEFRASVDNASTIFTIHNNTSS